MWANSSVKLIRTFSKQIRKVNVNTIHLEITTDSKWEFFLNPGLYYTEQSTETVDVFIKQTFGSKFVCQTKGSHPQKINISNSLLGAS